MLRGHLTGTRFGLLLAVVAGVVLGAVFGQPGAGVAASTARPSVASRRKPSARLQRRVSPLGSLAAESSARLACTATCGATYSPDSPRQVWIHCAETSTSAFRISPVRGSTLEGPTA